MPTNLKIVGTKYSYQNSTPRTKPVMKLGAYNDILKSANMPQKWRK